jgi:hypothetical protein
MSPKNSLQFDPDLSVPWREHLAENHNAGPEAVLADDARYSLVFEITADQAEGLGLTPEHTPDPDQGHPVGCAHSSLWRAESLGPKQRRKLGLEIALAMVLVHGAPTIPTPDGA